MSLDRVRKEHEAQRARATAMRHLSETGSGPSYQEQLREENARSKYKNKVSQFITQQYPESSLMTVDPRIRDNTLQVIAQRNAKALSTSNSLSDREQYYTKEELRINSNCKTSKQVETWKEAFDSESGQKYFWNEVSQATDNAINLFLTNPTENERNAVGASIRKGCRRERVNEIPDV